MESEIVSPTTDVLGRLPTALVRKSAEHRVEVTVDHASRVFSRALKKLDGSARTFSPSATNTSNVPIQAVHPSTPGHRGGTTFKLITTMPTYKFHVGQKVEMVPADRFSPQGVFEIVRLLPLRDGEFQYRIKSIDEPHERVAKESLLRRL